MPKSQLQSTEFAKGAGKPLAASGNAIPSTQVALIPFNNGIKSLF